MAAFKTWSFINSLLLCGIISLFVKHACTYLDIDELNSIHYGIDILSDPVFIGEITTDKYESVVLTSKHGQDYQCYLPGNRISQKQKEEEEKVALETGIPELLRPMETVPCLMKHQDWWSYEFCYGKHIRQYHMEDGKIVGNVLYLGYYESEYDWNNETKEFVCDDGVGDHIGRIDEPETCVYIMRIYTTKICHHPYLKPPKPREPVGIRCNPLITEDQYIKYIDKIREKTMIKEEEERLKELEILKQLEESEASIDELNEDDDELLANNRNRIQQSLASQMKRGVKNAFQEAVGIENMDVKMDLKIVDDQDDIENFIKRAMTTTPITKQSTDKDKKSEKEKTKSSTGKVISQDRNSDLYDAEDKDLIKEFDEELNDLEDDKILNIATKTEGIRSAMEDQFDEIINEAQNELTDEGFDEPIDKKVAFSKLAKTLNKLMQRLEKNEEEIMAVDKEIEEYNKKTDDKDKSAVIGDNRNKKVDDSKPRATLKVKRMKTGELQSADDDDNIAIPEDQRKRLEKSVMEGLEKAGFDAGGENVQVKIITVGYNDDDDTLHILSDEDTSQFQNMIVAILGGTNEAAKEEQHQQQLEENYNAVFINDETEDPAA